MPSFGERSRKHLGGVHPELRAVLDESIKHYDFTVLAGFRGEREQNEAYRNGYSKLKWPNSEHNKRPSRAVDIAPWPEVYNASKRDWYEMATHVLRAASKLGVDVRWGGHFNGFFDGAHFELGPEEKRGWWKPKWLR